MPPLRKRREDIPLLVSHFIKKGNKRENKSITRVDTQGMKRLMEHRWPGNIRELENAIEHAFVICGTDQIILDDLPVEIRQPSDVPIPSTMSLNAEDTEKSSNTPAISGKLTREGLLGLLEQCSWNKAEVGRRIQKSRTSVWKYMKKWGIPLQKE